MGRASFNPDLPAVLREIAAELFAPLECTDPAYGAPGYAHCAACCYGKGYVLQCEADKAVMDVVNVLERSASRIEADLAAHPPITPLMSAQDSAPGDVEHGGSK